jgi:outer membrane usher protein
LDNISNKELEKKMREIYQELADSAKAQSLFQTPKLQELEQQTPDTFFLPKASQVEIRINHRTVRRLYLPAGYHEISGFSGVEGTNFVEIYVTKEDGSLEIIPYEFQLGNSRNLPKGEYRYSATVGVRRSGIPMGYDYHISEPGISSDLLYGLLPALSLGISGQASQNNLMAGPQALFSLNKANFLEFKNLANLEGFAKGGIRSELRYSYRTKPVSYSITTYYQSEEYNPNLFRSLSSPGTNYAGLSTAASTRLFKGSISANAGLFLNKETEQTLPVSKRYGVSLSQSIYRVSLSANFNVAQEKTGWQPYASFGTGYSFGVDRHNFAITNTTAMNSIAPDYDEYEWKNRSNLNWNWSNGGSGMGTRSYSAGITSEDFGTENASLQMGARHSYNRANVSVAYNMHNYDYDYMSMLTHTIKADIGTSFMFADGLWAFGRPANKGFILAGPGKSLKGSTIHVNYSDYHNTSFSESGWLGTAYYNQISNYRSNEIRISLTDAPMNTWLEQNHYYTMGAYKQGYAIRLGSDANVLLQLTLLREDGPLSYTYLSIDNRSTFTGKDGVLLVGNLKPSQKYLINFGENSPIKEMEIHIPEDAGNFIELPDMKVEYK